jgi:hypothetical protein
MSEVFAILFVGRWIKYLFISSLCRFAPGKIQKLWGLKGELKTIEGPQD